MAERQNGSVINNGTEVVIEDYDQLKDWASFAKRLVRERVKEVKSYRLGKNGTSKRAICILGPSYEKYIKLQSDPQNPGTSDLNALAVFYKNKL